MSTYGNWLTESIQLQHLGIQVAFSPAVSELFSALDEFQLPSWFQQCMSELHRPFLYLDLGLGGGGSFHNQLFNWGKRPDSLLCRKLQHLNFGICWHHAGLSPLLDRTCLCKKSWVIYQPWETDSTIDLYIYVLYISLDSTQIATEQ